MAEHNNINGMDTGPAEGGGGLFESNRKTRLVLRCRTIFVGFYTTHARRSAYKNIFSSRQLEMETARNTLAD